MGNSFDITAFIGLIMRVVSICIIALYIVPKSFIQALRPRDWLTGLRIRLLLMFSFAIVASVPSMVYQIIVSRGDTAPLLKSVVNITGNLSFLAISILLVMIYNYRKRE